MRAKLRAALALPRRDWGILLPAWGLLLAVDLGVRILPFRWVQRSLMMPPWIAGVVPEDEAAATVQRLGRVVGMASRHHLRPMRCLQQSLVLQWLLARHGIVAELRIGARKEPERLSAHAWLEHRGRSVGEPHTIETRFPPLVAQSADG